MSTYNCSRSQHGVIAQVVNDVDLEVCALVCTRSVNYDAVRERAEQTLLPVITGPGNTPFITTAARVNPSGETSALEIVKSAVGPMAAVTRRA